MSEFYDIVDSQGNIIETAEQQRLASLKPRTLGAMDHDECAPWCDHNPNNHTEKCEDSFCDGWKCWEKEGLVRTNVETKEQRQAAQLTSATLPEETPAVLDPKPLTDFDLRKLRKLYVTVQHPKVKACGHRLDMGRQPTHRNCESCWFAWFNEHGQIVQQLDEMLQTHGEELIVKLQGKKFLHRWLQFMSTVAQWKQVGELSGQTN